VGLLLRVYLFTETMYIPVPANFCFVFFYLVTCKYQTTVSRSFVPCVVIHSVLHREFSVLSVQCAARVQELGSFVTTCLSGGQACR